MEIAYRDNYEMKPQYQYIGEWLSWLGTGVKLYILISSPKNINKKISHLLQNSVTSPIWHQMSPKVKKYPSFIESYLVRKHWHILTVRQAMQSTKAP